jgi:hypothetical protein
VGWPHDLAPPGTDEFRAGVATWLLDRGPAELRTSPVRTLPLALGRIVAHHVDACLDGTRRAYAKARVELGEFLPPDQLAVVQSALEAEGARLLTMRREVTLVDEALQRAARADLRSR